MSEIRKGYKIFNKDLKCRGFQYEIGKEYKHEGEIKLCVSGFHFCQKCVDAFNYYEFDPKNRVCEVEALGQIITSEEDSKCVTNHIRIGRELTWHEVLDLVNTGKNNTGNRNSGDWNSGNENSGNRNSGDWNSGNRNSGNRNSGYWNSGDWNSGDWNSGNENSGNRNSGYWNSGDWNSGDWNSGYWNSGNRNSGDWNSGNENSGNRNSGDWNSGNRNSGNRNSGYWNSGNRNSGNRNSGNRNSGNRNSGNENSGNWNSGNENSGYFNNTLPENVRVFGKYIPRSEYNKIRFPDFCCFDPQDDKNLSRIENYKASWRTSWDKADDEDRRRILDIPGFDNEIFLDITGIDVYKEVSIEKGDKNES